MKPIKFKEQNCTYAENQPEYMPLPAHKTEEGEVVTCWEFSFKDKIRILFNRKLWLGLRTFNKPLQPIALTLKKKDVFI